MKPGEIDLRIDELVLEGVPPIDRLALANALRAGLARALARSENQAALLASLRARDHLDGGEITLSGTDAASVGEALAATIVATLHSSASDERGLTAR